MAKRTSPDLAKRILALLDQSGSSRAEQLTAVTMVRTVIWAEHDAAGRAQFAPGPNPNDQPARQVSVRRAGRRLRSHGARS